MRMTLSIEVLQLLADGETFPVGSTREGFDCGVVPGLRSIRKPVTAIRENGEIARITAFSDEQCPLHQFLVQANGRWEEMTNFSVLAATVETMRLARLDSLVALAREVA